jgi:transcriptional regulator with XRE-family HTH domain
MAKKRASHENVLLKRVGARIRKVRLDKGFSQESLALAAGLDRSYIGGVERGERNISVVNLVRLAKALAVPASNLLEDIR